MFEGLAKNGREFEEKIVKHVQEYTNINLRTLILAHHHLDEEEYRDFDKMKFVFLCEVHKHQQ